MFNRYWRLSLAGRYQMGGQLQVQNLVVELNEALQI